MHQTNLSEINFHIIEPTQSRPFTGEAFFLRVSDWDDYSYKTSFFVTYLDPYGKTFDLGTVKIGLINQEIGWTRSHLPSTFSGFTERCFSLGQDVNYYKNIKKFLNGDRLGHYLRAMQDVVQNVERISALKSEMVFKTSLMRSVSLSTIQGQFDRVLKGLAELTPFNFIFRSAGDDEQAAIDLAFDVDPESSPPTNLHVLSGRNGVGKTTILNNMVTAIVSPERIESGRFGFFIGIAGLPLPLPRNYFSSVVSVSFSAFDPFIPPLDQPDRSKGVAYFYIDMKQVRHGYDDLLNPPLPPKTDTELASDILNAIESCLSEPEKSNRWGAAIEHLNSDRNFAEISFGKLLHKPINDALNEAKELVSRLSSGHAIVLLTLTRLVANVEEKTLVLLDEPESHLHPPLLAAFMRALSDLLSHRNGVAIIATHSPVVVQEVPKSCVWKITRSGNSARQDRPERETFGENVGMLTREIFGLEVSKSGFHDVLARAVAQGMSFEQILQRFKGQLGMEAQAIVLALLSERASLAQAGRQE